MHAAGFLLCLALVAGCGQKPEPPKPASTPVNANDPALTGQWLVTAITTAGKPVPAERVQGSKLTYEFDGKAVTVRRPNHLEQQSRYTTTQTSNPKWLAMTLNGAPTNASYRVADTRLELCLNVDDGAAPLALESTASPKTTLLILEKVK